MNLLVSRAGGLPISSKIAPGDERSGAQFGIFK